MKTASPPRAGGAAILARLALAAAALALAALSWADAARWSAAEARLARFLEEGYGGRVPPALLAEVRREPDAERAKLRAARGALTAETRAERFAGLSAGAAAAERAKSAARLEATARLAAEALAVRPAAWDGAMVLGAATYLARSLARDDRLLTDYRSWERPLETALELGRGKREPARFLAAAYLELWPSLSPAKRDRTRRLLAGIFRDRDGFRLLVGPWLAVAPSRAAALALVPEDPEAWDRLQQVLAERQDWAGVREARERGGRALRTRLLADLAEAEERLRNGDPNGARNLFLRVASRAERGVRQVDLLARALAGYPPGPVDPSTGASLAAHLDWILDRCQVAGCPLPPTALRRLARASRDLEPPQTALAALMAGDLDRAELVERRTEAQWSEAWAPYLVAKAGWLAERGRAEEAAAALAQVHRDWQGKPSYWRARAAVARAAADPRDGAEAARRLRELAAGEWPATAWTWRRGRARLEMLTTAESSGLEVELDTVPAGGALVELRLDGTPLGSFVAAAPGRPVRLALGTPLRPGLHLLQIDALAGGPVAPGAVRLAPLRGGYPGAGV